MEKEKMTDKQALFAAWKRLERGWAVWDRLMEKLEQAAGELELQTVVRKTKFDEDGVTVTEERRFPEAGGMVDRAGLKQILSVLKELQDLQEQLRAQQSLLSAEERPERDQTRIKLEKEVKKYAK